MPVLFIYVLKLSCSLGVIWLFYRLLLRNLTFYELNRWYLFGYALLAFLLPLIDIGPMLQKDAGRITPLITHFIPVVGADPVSPGQAPMPRVLFFNLWWILAVLMAAGSLFLFARTAIRFFSLLCIRRRSTLIGTSGNMNIYQVVDQHVVPFSFGKAVFINRQLYTQQEWEDIIYHEYAHVHRHHTLDVLVAEMVVILNWYNPFAWAIRYSIRQNLEFIADNCVLGKGFDRKRYQYHLLTVGGDNRYRLGNNFNFSSLKKRIVMMNKLRSARLHLIRFLFILPLLSVLLVAFRDRPPQHPIKWSGPPYRQIAGNPDTLPNFHNVVWVIDGEIKNNNGMDYKLGKSSVGDIVRINVLVLKDEEMNKLFGDRGYDGVEVVLTKAYLREHPLKNDTLYLRPSQIPLYLGQKPE